MEEERESFQQEVHGHHNATSMHGDASVHTPITLRDGNTINQTFNQNNSTCEIAWVP